ncbi:MAG: PKD domain-containing protein [Rhodothermales bacterium]
MSRTSRLPFLLALCALIGLARVPQATAQTVPGTASGPLFVEGRLQTNLYSGDRVAPWISGLDGLTGRFGPGAGLSVGYRLSEPLSVVGNLTSGIYPEIDRNSLPSNRLDPSTTSSRRNHLSAEVRYTLLPIGRFTPFLAGGLGTYWGRLNGSRTTAVGPQVGLGIQTPLFGWPVFLRLDQFAAYPNDGLDGAGAISTSPDAVTTVSMGIVWTRKPRPPRLGDVVISVPAQVRTGDEALFLLSAALDPVSYAVAWDFGDGQRASTASAVHRYASPGTYTVRVTASTARDEVIREIQVTVLPVFERVSILSVTATPRSPRPGETVTFTPILRGTPTTCLWSFGDGRTSALCEAEHTFDAPGTYRVALQVQNEAHSAVSEHLVTVQADVCSSPPPLHVVFFGRNSSTLSLAMRELLRENMVSIGSCPGLQVVVQGYALASEQAAGRADDLATARAEAVVQYYVNLGLAAGRVEKAAPRVLGEAAELGRSVDSYLQTRN